MAGKSGRSINNVPESPVKKMIFSWEGILVLLFIAVNIFCAMFSEYYNLSSLLRQMPVYLAEVFMMLPMAYILVLGEIDISVGAIVCLSATMSCIVCNTNAPFIVVEITALGVGTICGAVNGFILTKFQELPPMIVTLATQIIFRGISEIVLGSGGSISASNTDGFRAIGGKIGNVPYILFLVVILSVIFAVILGKSTFGRRVYAIGTNRLTAYYSGVHVQKIRFVIYTLMGTISGLCALFLMSSSFGANTTTSNGFEMDAIAMAVFGGISSTGGKGNIAGGLISAFIIVCLRVGLGQRNIHPQVILLIIGVLLAVSLFLINNTISVAAAFRRQECQIMRLIGATNFMIRAPFIVEGVMIGLIGALIPLAGTYFLYTKGIVYLSERFHVLSNLFYFVPVGEIYPLLIGAALILGVGIGFFGSFFTIRKYMKV